MRFDGKITSWNDERGFGFIASRQGGQDIFVHITSFPAGTGRPVVGLALSFELERNAQGKQRARAVQFAQPSPLPSAPRHEPPATWTLPRLLVMPAFVALYAAVASRWSVSTWVAVAYGVVSCFAFLSYAIDKSAARHGRWRTPESTLHFFSLAGGWPGALLAQQWLRHKLSKPPFVAAFWGTVVVNVALFVAVHAYTAQVRSL